MMSDLGTATDCNCGSTDKSFHKANCAVWEGLGDWRPGTALAASLMAANYPGDSGEDVDRLIAELASRGYGLAALATPVPADDLTSENASKRELLAYGRGLNKKAIDGSHIPGSEAER